MVIQKFNNLIRNKWVWGVFALAVSAIFVLPDGCLSDSRYDDKAENKLKKADLDRRLFEKCRFLVRSGMLGDQNLAMLFNREKADSDWKLYAAMTAFDEMGVVVSDKTVDDEFNAAFSDPNTKNFDKAKFDEFAARLGVTRLQYKDYLCMLITVRMGLAAVGFTYSSNATLQRDAECYKASDKFTVKVATFNEDKKAADKITVDDAAIQEWYNNDTNTVASLRLPDRYKLSYLKLNVADTNILSKITVTDADIEDCYKKDCEDGEYVVTNDVFKPLSEVRPTILAKLQRKAVKDMVYDAFDANESNDRFLDEYAALNKTAVKTSGWISFDRNQSMGPELYNYYVAQGDLSYPNSEFTFVTPEDFKDKIFALEDGSAKLEIISTDNSIWIFKLVESSPSHIPELAAIKPVVKKMALSKAKAEAFKKTVDGVKAKGFDEVLKSAGATSNVVFQLTALGFNGYSWDYSKAGFENAWKIIPEACKLKKGEVSEMIPLSAGKAALVACVDRVPGTYEDYTVGLEHASKVVGYESQYFSMKFLIDWLEWNMARFGYEKEN